MGTPLLWVGFNLFILLALALDLGVFHRKAHKIKLAEAAVWSGVWIGLAITFGCCVWHWYGADRGLEYFTGYVIEKALSVDNLFVFLVIFQAFHVPEEVQHRVLAWGILGALVMRGAMIAAGAALVARFDWIIPAFGIFLVYTGVHMMWKHDKTFHYERNPVFRFANSHLRMTPDYRGARFFLREEGRLLATPLVIVLLIVEITDVTFAVDSIPAIFGITHDAFIVYTSNIFAILGLRTLYFLLAGVLGYFRHLSLGLAMVLIFIGGKMMADRWMHLPVGPSLAVVGGILLLAVLVSVVAGPAKTKEPPAS
jgi:tellurite resistance protein TerC